MSHSQDTRRRQTSSSHRDRDDKKLYSSRYDDDYRDKHRRDDDYVKRRDKEHRRRSRSRSKSRDRHDRYKRSRSRSHDRKRSVRRSSPTRSPSREQKYTKTHRSRTPVKIVDKETFESLPGSSHLRSNLNTEHSFSSFGNSSMKCEEESRSQSPNSIRNIVLPNEIKQESSSWSYNDDDSNPYELDGNAEIDKERIQKEMQERLRQHLAAEGKVYPPPRPQAQHPIFANDGSFLETFKQLQHHQQQMMSQAPPAYQYPVKQETVEPKVIVQQPAAPLPLFGKRRGGKILKTGIVEKPKPIPESDADTAKDAWSMYMQEVKKYKTTACDIAAKTRPLLK